MIVLCIWYVMIIINFSNSFQASTARYLPITVLSTIKVAYNHTHIVYQEAVGWLRVDGYWFGRGWTSSSAGGLAKRPHSFWAESKLKNMEGLLSFFFNSQSNVFLVFVDFFPLNFKGAQAWEFFACVFCTKWTHLGRWLGDWTKKAIFLSIDSWFWWFLVFCPILSVW